MQQQDLELVVGGGYSFCRRTGYWSILCPVVVTSDEVHVLHPRGPYGVNTQYICSSYDHDSFWDVMVGQAIRDSGLEDACVYCLIVTEYEESVVSADLRQRLAAGEVPKQGWHVFAPSVYPVKGGWTVIDIQPLDEGGSVPEDHRARILEVAQDIDFWRKINQQIKLPKRVAGVDEQGFREEPLAEQVPDQVITVQPVPQGTAFDDDDDCPF